jgi:hypothetical protein
VAILRNIPSSEALSDGRAATKPAEIVARTQAVESVNFMVVCKNFCLKRLVSSVKCRVSSIEHARCASILYIYIPLGTSRSRRIVRLRTYVCLRISAWRKLGLQYKSQLLLSNSCVAVFRVSNHSYVYVGCQIRVQKQ